MYDDHHANIYIIYTYPKQNYTVLVTATSIHITTCPQTAVQ